MRAIAASGQTSDWSDPKKFIVATQGTGSRVPVSNLVAELLGGSIYLIRGRAEPGTTIRVAGRETIVPDKGSFQLQITAPPGTQEISIDAEDPRGNVSHIACRFRPRGKRLRDEANGVISQCHRHVILLTDAHEAPAYELIEVVAAGRREDADRRTARCGTRSAVRGAGNLEYSAKSATKLPIAVLYEVVPGADMVELHGAIEHAKDSWPGTPLIACRRQLSGFHGQSWRSLDGATLKRLGFRAIADKAAQLPAILHEIEGHGATGELKLPELASPPLQSAVISLPANMKASKLRAAFDLVSSLHFIGDQNSAAQTALAGLAPLVKADRWTIYLLSDPKARRFRA